MLTNINDLGNIFFDYIEWSIILLTIVAAAVVVTIITFIHYQQAKKETRKLSRMHTGLLQDFDDINKDLQEKSRQISCMTLHLMTVDNSIEKFLKSTSEREHDIHQLKLDVRQFYRELRSAQQSIASVKLFFENTDPCFFDSMKEQYPSVSEQDLKLLAFLKMNMSNKEISNVMNVTTGAVFQSKRRLKKKLGLTPEENLREFVQHFQQPTKSDHQFALN